jgi:hypothetical protein
LKGLINKFVYGESHCSIMVAVRKFSMPLHPFPRYPCYENALDGSDWDEQKLRNSKSPRWQRLEHHEQNDCMSSENHDQDPATVSFKTASTTERNPNTQNPMA